MKANIEVYYIIRKIIRDKLIKQSSGGAICSGKTKTTFKESYLIVTHG